MKTIQIRHFKELLNYLTEHQHSITVSLNLWCYGEARQIIQANYQDVKQYFTDDMIHDWNSEPITFTDIHNHVHEFNTTKQNRVRLIFIHHYDIRGNLINKKIRGFKQLLHAFDSTHDVRVSFMIQRNNNRPYETKRKPDSFLHFRTPFKNIERQFDYDMFFNYHARHDFKFKRTNDKPFHLQRHRIRRFRLKHITKGVYNMNQVKVKQVSEDKKKFHYMLLSRLQMDCNYFLGNGNRHEKHLWSGSVEGQIAKMKELWLSFAEKDKPEWLTWQDILNYEKEMLS